MAFFYPRALVLSLFLLLTTGAFAQTPVLVADLNPGTEGAFTRSSPFVNIGSNRLVTLADDGTTGLEPYVLVDDAFTLLADIVPGNDSDARFSSFYVFEGHLYFFATNTPVGAAVWRTDGTPEGTEQFLDVNPDDDGDSASNPVFDGDDNLYYTAGGDLYRYQLGTQTTTLVREDYAFRFGGIFSSGSRQSAALVTGYNDGLALLFRRDDDVLELQHLVDTTIIVLDTFSLSEFQTFGISPRVMRALPGGLFFSLERDQQQNNSFGGNFVFDEAADSIRTLSLPNIVDRLLPINDSLLIAQAALVGGGIREDEYYAFTDINPSGEVILDGVDYDSFFGGRFRTYSDGERLIWTANYGLGIREIHVTDGTVEGTRRLYTFNSDTEGFSNFFPVGETVYWANGVNRFLSDGQLFRRFDPTEETPELETYFTESTLTVNDEELQFVAAINDRLYFTWNLDNGTGTELYYIVPPDFATSVNGPTVTAQPLTLAPNPTSGLVRPTAVCDDCQLTVYDANGRAITTGTYHAGRDIDLTPYPAGLYYVRIQSATEVSVGTVIKR